MKLYGEYLIHVQDRSTGKTVFAGLYDTAAERDEALLKTVAPRYGKDARGNQFSIAVGQLFHELPSLAGHPPENLARIAAIHDIPIEFLIRAQEIEEYRKKNVIRGYAAKHRDLIWAVALAMLSSVFLYEARLKNHFMDAMNLLGLLSAVTFLGSLWFVRRYASDGSLFATLALVLFLGALFGDSIIGPTFASITTFLVTVVKTALQDPA